MVERINTERVRRSVGSQPVFHDSPTVDALTAMVIGLLGEVVVLRDRLDACERLSERSGSYGPDDVDRFQPDEAAKSVRRDRRLRAYDRVLGVIPERLLPETSPAPGRQQLDGYEQLIRDVGRE